MPFLAPAALTISAPLQRHEQCSAPTHTQHVSPLETLKSWLGPKDHLFGPPDTDTALQAFRLQWVSTPSRCPPPALGHLYPQRPVSCSLGDQRLSQAQQPSTLLCHSRGCNQTSSEESPSKLSFSGDASSTLGHTLSFFLHLYSYSPIYIE